MTIKQMLLLTSLILLLTLQSASGLRGQIHQARQEAQEARQEVAKARQLELESERYETQVMNITMYAPLSPGSIAGQDYYGDPNLTASGEQLVPGETAAAGPNVPFGTRIYIEGIGWYTVQDRGRAIGPNDIDLAVDSREKSIEFGKQQRLVIFELPKPREEEDSPES
jgi:3D (Asp-Asp-Asp) domain-containing protein